jgi:hypothetical protein
MRAFSSRMTQPRSIAAREYALIPFEDDYDMTSATDCERLMQFLPEHTELRSGLVRRIRALVNGLEIVDVAKIARSVMLEDGSTWERTKVYGRFMIDSYIVEDLLAKEQLTDRERAGLDREIGGLLDDMAKLIAEEIEIFCAERNLTSVTLRAHPNLFGAWLQRRSDGSHFRVSQLTDQWWAPIGAYYFITPPGNQVNP